jgi:antiviral helicase SKI2
MDTRAHEDVLDKLLHPDKSYADEILRELGLASLPSREQVHREIEEKLLLPQDTFPDHWLSQYQVYVSNLTL